MTNCGNVEEKFRLDKKLQARCEHDRCHFRCDVGYTPDIPSVECKNARKNIWSIRTFTTITCVYTGPPTPEPGVLGAYGGLSDSLRLNNNSSRPEISVTPKPTVPTLTFAEMDLDVTEPLQEKMEERANTTLVSTTNKPTMNPLFTQFQAHLMKHHEKAKSPKTSWQKGKKPSRGKGRSKFGKRSGERRRPFGKLLSGINYLYSF